MIPRLSLARRHCAFEGPGVAVVAAYIYVYMGVLGHSHHQPRALGVELFSLSLLGLTIAKREAIIIESCCVFPEGNKPKGW